MGLRVWSGGEIVRKKIKKEWGAHKAPPLITKVKENAIIAGLGACKSYECYQNINYFPALVKGYVILDMQLGPLDNLQCFQIYHIQIDIEKLAFIHVHCFIIPRTRISFFLDEGQGVPGDKVILHPGDDTLAPQNPKIQILM